jgi:hypothetical protein
MAPLPAALSLTLLVVRAMKSCSIQVSSNANVFHKQGDPLACSLPVTPLIDQITYIHTCHHTALAPLLYLYYSCLPAYSISLHPACPNTCLSPAYISSQHSTFLTHPYYRLFVPALASVPPPTQIVITYKVVVCTQPRETYWHSGNHKEQTTNGTTHHIQAYTTTTPQLAES